MTHVLPVPGPAGEAVDPVPREARAFQGRPAGIVTRTCANAIDFAVVVGVLVGGYAVWFAGRFLISPAHFTAPRPPFLVVLLCGAVLLFCYFAAAWSTTGRTYGDHLLGLRVVDSRGERLRWRGAIVRAGFCVLFPIGLYWSVVSPRGRSVQDAVLRTSVLYDWTTTRRTPVLSGRVSGSSRLPPTTGLPTAPGKGPERDRNPERRQPVEQRGDDGLVGRGPGQHEERGQPGLHEAQAARGDRDHSEG